MTYNFIFQSASAQLVGAAHFAAAARRLELIAAASECVRAWHLSITWRRKIWLHFVSARPVGRTDARRTHCAARRRGDTFDRNNEKWRGCGVISLPNRGRRVAGPPSSDRGGGRALRAQEAIVPRERALWSRGGIFNSECVCVETDDSAVKGGFALSISQRASRPKMRPDDKNERLFCFNKKLQRVPTAGWITLASSYGKTTLNCNKSFYD